MVTATNSYLRERFYNERDRRTQQYQPGALRFDDQVAVVVGRDAAETPAGQVAALALVNMLARFHRRIRLETPAVPLVACPLVVGRDLEDACVAVIRAIDPFCGVEVGPGVGDAVVSIGVGTACPRGMTWYLGAEGFCGVLARGTTSFRPDATTRWGAALAACLGAAAAFRSVHGLSARASRISLWDMTEGPSASPGPQRDHPISVGSIALVGAGAVGSALCYWLREFGIEGFIEVIDGDVAKLHNTNRTIGLTAADADWPDLRTPQPKAQAAAALVGGKAFLKWFSAWERENAGSRPDLVIPVANEGGVRAAIHWRGEGLLIHASTSPNWTAELHRHRAEIDDCMVCRMPAEGTATLLCSTAPLAPASEERGDAALSFLSGAAGLLLAAGMARLQDRELLPDARNHWRLHLDLGHRTVASSRWPRKACPHQISPAVRASVAGGRWSAFT